MGQGDGLQHAAVCFHSMRLCPSGMYRHLSYVPMTPPQG